ncbi:MAG: hypothetical protein ACC651_17560, partial [Candidatus Scalindua sp.]
MKESTAQKREETPSYLRLVHDQDTTSDLRNPEEVTKDAIIREIDTVVKKYGSASTGAIELLEQELCAHILKKEPEFSWVEQFVSGRLYSQISSLSNSWAKIGNEHLDTKMVIIPWASLLPGRMELSPQYSITNYQLLYTGGRKQLPASSPLFSSPDFLEFDADIHPELPEDVSNIVSDGVKKTNTLEAILKELQELSQYESDWDGHGGRAISKRACEHAESFVSMMENKASFFEPYPDPDGSVGL